MFTFLHSLGNELNGLNGAIDAATVDFSGGALRLVVNEAERAGKAQQDGLGKS